MHFHFFPKLQNPQLDKDICQYNPGKGCAGHGILVKIKEPWFHKETGSGSKSYSLFQKLSVKIAKKSLEKKVTDVCVAYVELIPSLSIAADWPQHIETANQGMASIISDEFDLRM